jgi:hypothetical protein
MATTAARTWWCRVKSAPIEYPLSFGVLISAVKTSVSDLLVQRVVERREEIDWRRNAAFATFGFFYLGGVQYMIYVPLFGRLFPNAAAFASKPLREKIKDFRGLRDLLAQVFLDQCVHHPFVYFPAFYCTKELVMNPKPDFYRSLMEYRGNVKDDLIALWKVWVPSTLVSFYIPFLRSKIRHLLNSLYHSCYCSISLKSIPYAPTSCCVLVKLCLYAHVGTYTLGSRNFPVLDMYTLCHARWSCHRSRNYGWWCGNWSFYANI